MTRSEFIQKYAQRSGIPAEWADLGLIDCPGGRTLIALPCGCGDASCLGWAMLSAESVLTHLDLYAPDKLRQAYGETVSAAEAAP